MGMTFITFGQDHTHRVNDITIDKDLVIAIPSESRGDGRNKAFELFGPKWSFEYYNDDNKQEFKKDSLVWFPRGIINIVTREKVELP